MSDIYHKDTTASLEKFNDILDELSPVIKREYIDILETLANEVDGLLSMYFDNIKELEAAKELVEYLENKE